MVRQKSFVRYFFRLWGWLALVAAVGTAFLYLVAQHTSQSAERLKTEGADATAELTQVYRSSTRDTDGDLRYSYYVSYRFLADGKAFEGEQKVSYGYYQKVGTGKVVPVRFWRIDPSLSEVEPGRTAVSALLTQTGTAIFGLGTLIFASLGWKRARSAAWMFRHGVEREANVTGHVDCWLEVNNGKRWRATWREGDGRTGSTYMHRIDCLPPVGIRLTVYSDPDGRRASIWVGDL
jgi:hypothetical protein